MAGIMNSLPLAGGSSYKKLSAPAASKLDPQVLLDNVQRRKMLWYPATEW
jgi:hypothetical protein